jgi:hypothetical protein
MAMRESSGRKIGRIPTNGIGFQLAVVFILPLDFKEGALKTCFQSLYEVEIGE